MHQEIQIIHCAIKEENDKLWIELNKIDSEFTVAIQQMSIAYIGSTFWNSTYGFPNIMKV